MGPSREARRERYLAKARAELDGLVARGVVVTGNAFSSVLLLKGLPTAEEASGATLLAGKDGEALRAALQALGYAPQDWAGLATWNNQNEPLEPELLREAICALDPATLIACDEEAAGALREAYASDLFLLQSFEEAMLTAGTLAQVAGMRVMNLGGFAAALGDKAEKQVMWRRLKQLPPLGEPY